jgi:hypothetical protein
VNRKIEIKIISASRLFFKCRFHIALFENGASSGEFLSRENPGDIFE